MMADIEDEKVGIVITKDLSRLGRDYLKTGELIEMVFPDYDVRYIAINDGIDTFKSENELMAFKNIFNDWYARDCSKKIHAVFKLCIDGYGPVQIARILTEQGIPTSTAYAISQGKDNGKHNAKLHRWGAQTICHILERLEYWVIQ